MASIGEIWTRLSDSSRTWLIDHNGEALPNEVITDLVAEGGPVLSDAWFVDGPTGFYLTDSAVDWVEEWANGER